MSKLNIWQDPHWEKKEGTATSIGSQNFIITSSEIKFLFLEGDLLDQPQELDTTYKA